jgi:hypothetical protein
MSPSTNGPSVAHPPPEDGGVRSYLYHGTTLRYDYRLHAYPGRTGVTVEAERHFNIPAGTIKKCTGCVVETDKPLWVRKHSCPSYGFKPDRDANASYNVLSRGIQGIGLGRAESTPVETANTVKTDGGLSSSVPASRVIEPGSLGV